METKPITPAKPTPIDGNRLTRHTYYRGRVAMQALLRALGIGPGDEVIVQAFTCVAVPEGVLACGAAPVFADIEADSYNAGVAEFATRFTDQTRAIVVQHTFGLPADIQGISALAAERGVPVIEDCCHTLRGTIGGQPLGTFGAGAFYSFEWGKPLVSGVGGSAVTNDSNLTELLAASESDYTAPSMARAIRLELQYRAFQAVYRPRWYWPVRSAFRWLNRAGATEGNFNAYDASEAAPDFGLKMVEHLRRRAYRKARFLDRDATKRLDVERRYRDVLGPIAQTLPTTPPDTIAPLARLPIRVANKQELLAGAEMARVELADWYTTAVHPLARDESHAIGYEPGSCLNAEKRATEVVSLPTHAGVDQRFIEAAGRLLRDTAVVRASGKEHANAA